MTSEDLQRTLRHLESMLQKTQRDIKRFEEAQRRTQRDIKRIYESLQSVDNVLKAERWHQNLTQDINRIRKAFYYQR